MTDYCDLRKDLEEAFCGVLTATTLRRVFLLLTQAHWAHPDNHGLLKPWLKDVVWHNRQELRRVYIQLQHGVNEAGLHSQLPAISVGLGDADFTNVVVGDYAGHNDDNSAHNEVRMCQTAVQFLHYANTSDLAGNMAESTFSFFTAAHQWLMGQLGLIGFEISQISMPQLVKTGEQHEFYRVDVRGVIRYNHVITISAESHRLKKVESPADVEGGGLDLVVVK